MKHSALLLATLVATATMAGAQTTYNGPAGGYITDSANWSSGLPTSANPGTVSTNTVFGNATGSGTPYTLTNYVFDLSAKLDRGYNFIPQFLNSSITVKSGGNLAITTPTDARATRLDGNTTITVETGGQFNTFTNNRIELRGGGVSGANPKVVVNGGTVTGGEFSVGTTVTAPAYPALQFGPGNGTVSLSNGTTGFIFDAASNAYVDFLSGSGGQLTVATKDASYYEGLWTAGRLRKNGANTGTFADNFLVTGATLTLKPTADPLLQVAASFSFTTDGATISPVIPVTNTGATQDLSISAITATGTDAATVSDILPVPPTVLSPGISQNIDFLFTPTGPGFHYFNIEVASNDAGQASPRVIPVTVEVREPLISAPAPSLDFGIKPFNPGPSTKTIVVTNTSTGTRALNITGTPVTGSSAFTVTSAPTSLDPGQSGNVVVTFDPGTTSGPMSASVQIQSDDYANTVPSFTFTAYVEPGDTPAARIDFGDATTPVESGYTGMVPAEGATLALEGLNFTLQSKDGSIIARDRGVNFGNLRRDCATTPGAADGEYLSVLITGLQAGELKLISSHQKAEGTGVQPINVLFGEAGSTLTTIASGIGRGDWVSHTTTVEAGKTYELRMLEASSNNSAYISSLLLYGAAVPGAGSGTPFTTWVSGYGLNPNWIAGDDPATNGTPDGDPDNDGFTNLQEFLFGTVPNAGNGALVTTTTTGGNLTLRWLQRSTGSSYALKENALLAGTWTTVTSPLPALDADQTGAPAGYEYWTVTLSTGAGRNFFRVEGSIVP